MPVAETRRVKTRRYHARAIYAEEMLIAGWPFRCGTCFDGRGEDIIAGLHAPLVYGTFGTRLTFHGLRLLRQASLGKTGSSR